MVDIRGPYTPLFGTATVPFPAYWNRTSNVVLVTGMPLKVLFTFLATPPAAILISKSFNWDTPCKKEKGKVKSTKIQVFCTKWEVFTIKIDTNIVHL